jgi:hypothetical protein
VQVTLGDLVAAAFDAVGGELRAVRRLLASDELARIAGRRILITP